MSSERKDMGWASYGTTGGDTPLPEEYSRVTNPERFRVLHSAMLDILDRLERDFDIRREEEYGLDGELERGFCLARPSVRLTPGDPEAAPLAVAFSGFPGLCLRFGLWLIEPFPDCGCDACGDSGERLVEELTDLIEDVTAGRLRESRNLVGPWQEHEIWGASGKRSGRRRLFTDSIHRQQVNWKPWPRRSWKAP